LKRTLLEYSLAVIAEQLKKKQQPQYFLTLNVAAVVLFEAVDNTVCQSNLAVAFVASPLVVVHLVVVDIVLSVVPKANDHIVLSLLLAAADDAVAVGIAVTRVPKPHGRIGLLRRFAASFHLNSYPWSVLALPVLALPIMYFFSVLVFSFSCY